MTPPHENSPPPNDHSQEKNQRQVTPSEESVIFNTFMLVIKNKFIASDPNKMQRYDLESYQKERKMLTKMNNNGMTAGIAIGVGSFLFLRMGPRMISRYLNRSRGTNFPSGSGGYQFDINNTAVNQPQQMMRPDTEPRRPGLFFRAVKLGLDLIVSVSLATWGSVLFMDSKKLMKDLSDIPLVEGRSLISEELCDDFINVYKAIPKRTWDKYNDKSVPLDAITDFVKNCLRRQMVEKEIVDEQKAFGSFGIDSNKRHVDIPPPGVPRDLSVEIPFSDKSEDLNVEMSVLLNEEDPFQESEINFSSWNGNGNDKENRKG